MRRAMFLWLSSFLITGAAWFPGQTAMAADDVKKAEVTYGRVKEIQPGQKVVIDVDNAIDKTFDLKDKDLRVVMGKNLKVGDPVKLVESKTTLGKTKSVTISVDHHNVKHGDKNP